MVQSYQLAQTLLRTSHHMVGISDLSSGEHAAYVIESNILLTDINGSHPMKRCLLLPWKTFLV